MINIPYTLTEGNGFRSPARGNRKTANAARIPINLPCLTGGTVALSTGTHLDDAYEPNSGGGGGVRGCTIGVQCEFLTPLCWGWGGGWGCNTRGDDGAEGCNGG